VRREADCSLECSAQGDGGRRPAKEPRTTSKSPNDCLLELRLHSSIQSNPSSATAAGAAIWESIIARWVALHCLFASSQRLRSSHTSPMYRNAGTHLLLPPFDLPSFRFQSHTPCFTHSHQLPYLVAARVSIRLLHRAACKLLRKSHPIMFVLLCSAAPC
jgi:hypothetical protein